MDIAWKVLLVLLITVACQYALGRVADRIRARRRRDRRPYEQERWTTHRPFSGLTPEPLRRPTSPRATPRRRPS
jgi:hypothetical protein